MKIISAIALLLFSHTGYADVLYEKFAADKSNKIYEVYLNGAYSALGFANAYASKEFGAKLYCQPSSLTLYYQNLVNLMDKYVEKNPKLKEVPVQLDVVLLYTMVDAFPCGQ